MRKTTGYALRHWWVLIAAIAAGCGSSFAQSSETSQEYTRRCLAKIQGMTASRDLSEWQSARISYLLQDQASMTELFSKHGLLNEGDLQKKILIIDEITRSGINEVLTRDQLAIWWTWDLKLDAASLRKPKPRQRLTPAP